MTGPVEPYRPRRVEDLGDWELGDVTFKIYGCCADGQAVTDRTIEAARRFLEAEVLPRVAQMGESNGLGFVIVHPGALGLTIAAQWWAQGSVLCQHIYRRQYDDPNPLDTVSRPAVACVWELEIIAAEQRIWREAMMTAGHDRAAYLAARATDSAA